MVELRNEQISIIVSEKGAELQSIKSTNGKEYLWQADPKYWNRHSPILFPIVCSVNNETYRVDGKEYHLPRHGFARDMEFKLIGKSERKVTFALESNQDTKKVYPYDFTLSVSYTLEDNKIGVIWHVLNTDKQEIIRSQWMHSTATATAHMKWMKCHLLKQKTVSWSSQITHGATTPSRSTKVNSIVQNCSIRLVRLR